MTSTELTSAPLALYWLRTPMADSMRYVPMAVLVFSGPDRNEPLMLTLHPVALSLP